MYFLSLHAARLETRLLPTVVTNASSGEVCLRAEGGQALVHESR